MSALIRFLFRFLLRAGALAGLAATGVAAYAAYSINSRRKRDLIDDYFITPYELKVPHRDISFQSADGYNLKGWLFENAESDRVLVGLTGRRVAKDSLIGIGTGLWRAGFNVLVFDFRGRGESDDGPQSVGHREMPDVKAALRFAKQQFPRGKIGLFGFSMGANLALRATAADPEIRAVMADSPFTSIEDLLERIFAGMRLPAAPIVALARGINRLMYGYDFARDSAAEAVAAIAPRPLLIIHGTADSTTPAAMAEELYERAGEPRELWLEPETEHCGVYFADRERYVKRVADFFDRSLRTAPAAPRSSDDAMESLAE
ncbi:MAG: alpha/beta hydrolase [Leptospirales bacterium]|jgi:alpha-beta hydrolase superfamily lysophospholipase